MAFKYPHLGKDSDQWRLNMGVTYARRFLRDPYEGTLVGALVACGYNIRLSTDEEDEIGGFDAEDIENAIRIDLYIGNGANGRYAQKLVKAAARGVRVFRVPATVVDDLCLPSCRQEALRKLEDLYYGFLSSRVVFRPQAQALGVPA